MPGFALVGTFTRCCHVRVHYDGCVVNGIYSSKLIRKAPKSMPLTLLLGMVMTYSRCTFRSLFFLVQTAILVAEHVLRLVRMKGMIEGWMMPRRPY